MRYLALAVDYDGTVAVEGRIPPRAASALERVRASGRRVILVTGRRLEPLLADCADVQLFDYVVAENGGLLYRPKNGELFMLAEPPRRKLVEQLREREVPLEIGAVIVATTTKYMTRVLESIQDLGFEVQIIFNRGALMLLPPGVNKASGLEQAVRRLALSRHEVVGVGDAQNDHSFLDYCECAIAVADAIESVRDVAAWVTNSPGADGVVEAIDELIAEDLVRLEGKLKQKLVLGTNAEGSPVWVPPYGRNVLLAGPSGSGKSTFATALIEQLIEEAYQVCVVDPEGDYGTLQQVVSLGNQRRSPSTNEVLGIIENPKINVSVNLLGIPLGDRPAFLAQLLPSLIAMRARTGRPHWIVLDEAHHMMPAIWGHAVSTLPLKLGETLVLTVHPEHLAPELLALVEVAIAIGPSPRETLQKFSLAAGRPLLWPSDLSIDNGWVATWLVHEPSGPFAVKPVVGRAERMRHYRKYAEGNVWQSFYFRGRNEKHNLKAQNLGIFAQIAEGIDEDTWLYHLHRSDYSRWFRDVIKDKYLAEQTEAIERRHDLSTEETRKLIRSLIQARYTLPD